MKNLKSLTSKQIQQRAHSSLTPEQIQQLLHNKLTPEQIQQLVHSCEPEYLPFKLKNLGGLLMTIFIYNRAEDIMHLRQQAMLAEAIAANERGEDMNYLFEFANRRNH
jgi:hypothetical protein